jgi:hypothetical protein
MEFDVVEPDIGPYAFQCQPLGGAALLRNIEYDRHGVPAATRWNAGIAPLLGA